MPEPDHVYIVRYQSRLPITQRVSYPFFEQLRAGFPTPDGLAAMSRVARMRLASDGGEPQSAIVQLVTGEFFGVLRRRAATRTRARRRTTIARSADIRSP